jgi:XTP/dITP diphosphohydrolase
MKLVFATHNAGKLRELRELVEPYGWQVLSADEIALEPVDEDAPTFAGNAEKKARAAFAVAELPALADDSGLEVDALDGAPGVRSARYAAARGACGDKDAANNATLLAALAGVPDERRTARFRCVLAFVDSTGAALFTEGACEGRIAQAPRGSGGFGYDPLFLVEGAGGRTMAELAADEKNAVSHRGRALRAMANALARRFRIL